MSKKFPLVSTVLNVYNEEDVIGKCLSYIRNQDYPQERIEIIIVDDDSEDNTLKLAEQFNVKVVRSGFRNRERAKSIGIEHAKGEFLLLMDADVFLISKKFVRRAVDLLSEHRKAVAAQCIRWHYKKNDHIINRYCNLFGINDPLVFFLGKRGVLMAIEDDWMYKETIVFQGKDFLLTEYTTRNLPTMGAQGYLARKNKIGKTSWKPYFFHLDTALEMVEAGDNQFILIKIPIEHRYVGSFKEYFTKVSRNLILFLELRKHRKYDYEISPLKLILPLFLMVTLILPLVQSIRGYIKKPDPAWFLHPFFCITIPMIYAFLYLKFRILKIK